MTTASGPGSNAAHTALVDDVMLAIGSLLYVRVWKRTVGLFYRVRFDDFGKVVSSVAVTVGQAGEPDLDGILTRWDGVGVRLGVECKSGKAKQNDDQKAYERMIKSRGGIYILARSAAETLSLIEQERMKGKPA